MNPIANLAKSPGTSGATPFVKIPQRSIAASINLIEIHRSTSCDHEEISHAGIKQVFGLCNQQRGSWF